MPRNSESLPECASCRISADLEYTPVRAVEDNEDVYILLCPACLCSLAARFYSLFLANSEVRV